MGGVGPGLGTQQRGHRRGERVRHGERTHRAAGVGVVGGAAVHERVLDGGQSVALAGVHLDGCRFEQVDLSRVRLPDAVVDGCTFTGCKRVAHTDGLCERHHAYLTACRESPLALTGGEWVVGRGGVRRWVA